MSPNIVLFLSVVGGCSAALGFSFHGGTSDYRDDAVTSVQTKFIYTTEDGGGEQQTFGSLLNTENKARVPEDMSLMGTATEKTFSHAAVVDTLCVPKPVGGASLVANQAFRQRVQVGIDGSRSRSIIFAGMLRDVTALGVERLFGALKMMASNFARFHIIVVENDSADDTRKGLKAECQGRGIWCFELEKSELGKKQDEFAPGRIEHLTTLRNLLLSKVHELSTRSTEPWDTLLMFDGDVFSNGNQGFDVGSTFAMLGRPLPGAIPDAVCANQLANWPRPGRYRDNFAIRNRDFSKRQDSNGTRLQEYFFGQNLMEVGSCFSGLTVFSMDAITESKCDFQFVDEETCEWVPFFQCLSSKGFGNVYLDPAWAVRMDDKGVAEQACVNLETGQATQADHTLSAATRISGVVPSQVKLP